MPRRFFLLEQILNHLSLSSARKHLPKIMAGIDAKLGNAVVNKLKGRQTERPENDVVNLSRSRVVLDLLANGELESVVNALENATENGDFGIMRGQEVLALINEFVDSEDRRNSTVSHSATSEEEDEVANVVEALAKIDLVTTNGQAEVQIGTLLHYTLHPLFEEDLR